MHVDMRPVSLTLRGMSIIISLSVLMAVAAVCFADCHGEHYCDCTGSCSHICTCAIYDPVNIEPVMRHSSYAHSATTDLPEAAAAGIFRPPKLLA